MLFCMPAPITGYLTYPSLQGSSAWLVPSSAALPQALRPTESTSGPRPPVSQYAICKLTFQLAHDDACAPAWARQPCHAAAARAPAASVLQL